MEPITVSIKTGATHSEGSIGIATQDLRNKPAAATPSRVGVKNPHHETNEVQLNLVW